MRETPLWPFGLMLFLAACFSVMAVASLDRTAELRGDIWVQQTRVANLEQLLTTAPSPSPPAGTDTV